MNSILLLAASFTLSSPDASYVTDVSQDEESFISYSVKYMNKDVVLKSALGIKFDNALFESALGIPLDEGDGWILVGSEKNSCDLSWQTVCGENATVRDRYNSLVLKFRKGSGERAGQHLIPVGGYEKSRSYSMDIEFRAYNEGVAFRYVFNEGSNGLFLNITDELTEFAMPEGTRALYTEWAQGLYEWRELKTPWKEAERPLFMKLPNGLKVALLEARLVDWARGKFSLNRDNVLKVKLFSGVEAMPPTATPWRVIMAGEKSVDLINNKDIVLNLNAPCEITDTSWIRPGKCFRCGLDRKSIEDGARFAKERGLEYIELDARWYGPEMSMESSALAEATNMDFTVEWAAKTAKESGLGLIVYVNQRALYKELDEILPLYKKWGVAGIKFGFVHVGNQMWTTWLHDAVKKCAEYGIMVDIHDEYRPTGFSRTYPNLMTQEGIAGNEEMPDARHNTILPFTRLLAGAADYTPCYYSRRVKNTKAHQLAMPAVYYSPFTFLFWYDKPQNYNGDERLEFWKEIPTTFDESVALAGEPGDFIVQARRSGATWFVGAMNGLEERTVEVDTHFLGEGEWNATIYGDDGIIKRKVNDSEKISLRLEASGGAGMIFRKAVCGDARRPIDMNRLSIKHPSLIFTPERAAEVNALAEKSAAFAAGRAAVLEQADKIAEKELRLHRAGIRDCEQLAAAAVLTKEAKYADAIKSILLRTAEVKDWSDKEMMERDPPWRSELQMAHNSYAASLGYDVAYERMSLEERMKVAKGLWRLAVEPSLGDWLLEPTRIHALNSMGHNWWTSCVYMPAMIALAVGNEIPEGLTLAEKAMDAMEAWYEFAGDSYQKKPRTFDRDGGMYESINYAQFGISESLKFLLAYKNAHGGKARISPALRGHFEKLPRFFCEFSYPHANGLWSVDFGDSSRDVVGDMPLELLLRIGLTTPEAKASALWYISRVNGRQHREGGSLVEPTGLFIYPDSLPEIAAPPIPKDMVYKDFGWAAMRTGWTSNDTFLAVKCGDTWNHAHADASSFILHHRGEDIVMDGGNISYGKREYREYYFQSQAHNVVLFNGKGQSPYQQYHGAMLRGEIPEMLSEGRYRYLLADATGPNSDNFYKYFRNFLWFGKTILVIDDLKTHSQGNFEWLWHLGGNVAKKGGDLLSTTNNASVVVRALYPATLVPSAYVHDYPDMLTFEEHEVPNPKPGAPTKYYGFKTQEKSDRVHAMTALLLKDSPTDTDLPRIERREGKNWIGLKISDGDETYDVYFNELADGSLMHRNSWIECDGITTDAYILVVSKEDILVIYGSAVRKGGKTLFSSLIKKNTTVRQ